MTCRNSQRRSRHPFLIEIILFVVTFANYFTFVIAIFFPLQYCFQTTFGYFVSNALLTVGFSLVTTILTSMMTKAVSDQDTGLVLGLGATCDSLLRTVTPSVGTFMYLQYGWPSLATLGSAVNFGMAVVLLVKV